MHLIGHLQSNCVLVSGDYIASGTCRWLAGISGSSSSALVLNWFGIAGHMPLARGDKRLLLIRSGFLVRSWFGRFGLWSNRFLPFFSTSPFHKLYHKTPYNMVNVLQHSIHIIKNFSLEPKITVMFKLKHFKNLISFYSQTVFYHFFQHPPFINYTKNSVQHGECFTTFHSRYKNLFQLRTKKNCNVQIETLKKKFNFILQSNRFLPFFFNIPLS